MGPCWLKRGCAAGVCLLWVVDLGCRYLFIRHCPCLIGQNALCAIACKASWPMWVAGVDEA